MRALDIINLIKTKDFKNKMLAKNTNITHRLGYLFVKDESNTDPDNRFNKDYVPVNIELNPYEIIINFNMAAWGNEQKDYPVRVIINPSNIDIAVLDRQDKDTDIAAIKVEADIDAVNIRMWQPGEDFYDKEPVKMTLCKE